MPEFELSGHSGAAIEDVWKLLFDPSRFPEWWDGIETVRTDGPGSYTQWKTGWPDFPLPQELRADRSNGRVMVSCQFYDIQIGWQLTADGGDGAGTTIAVHVRLPNSEVHRTENLRAMLTRSIGTLSELAAAA